MLIIINEVPISKNVYVNQHWSKRKQYKEYIAQLIWVEKLKIKPNKETNIDNWGQIKFPIFEKAHIVFDIYFKDKRRRDVQNYTGGGLIAWLDVLVDEMIIEDDCYDCIGQPIVNFHIDKTTPRTEILIERRS